MQINEVKINEVKINEVKINNSIILICDEANV